VAALSTLGFAAFVAASLAAGARLLWVASRARDAAALAVGASLALVGAGHAAMVAAFRLELVRESSYAAAFALATALLDLGLLALLLGLRQVFRPSARWAGVLVVAGAAALVASWVRGVAGFRPNAERTPFVFWTFNATAVAAYAWCAVECARAAGGSVDAAVRRRLLAWCTAACASAGIFAAGMAGRLLAAYGHPGVPLAQPLAAFAAGVAIGLAFVRPILLGVASDGAPGSAAEGLFRRVRG